MHNRNSWTRLRGSWFFISLLIPQLLLVAGASLGLARTDSFTRTNHPAAIHRPSPFLYFFLLSDRSSISLPCLFCSIFHFPFPCVILSRSALLHYTASPAPTPSNRPHLPNPLLPYHLCIASHCLWPNQLYRFAARQRSLESVFQPTIATYTTQSHLFLTAF